MANGAATGTKDPGVSVPAPIITEGLIGRYRVYRENALLVVVHNDTDSELYLTAQEGAELIQAIAWGTEVL